MSRQPFLHFTPASHPITSVSPIQPNPSNPSDPIRLDFITQTATTMNTWPVQENEQQSLSRTSRIRSLRARSTASPPISDTPSSSFPGPRKQWRHAVRARPVSESDVRQGRGRAQPERRKLTQDAQPGPILRHSRNRRRTMQGTRHKARGTRHDARCTMHDARRTPQPLPLPITFFFTPARSPEGLASLLTIF